MSFRLGMGGLALIAMLGLADEAFAQRFANPAAGRMPNAMMGGMGGSVRFNNGFNGNFNGNFNGMMPGVGTVGRTAGTWGNNQGLQPSNLRVPFTYTPGYRWYTGNLPYGNWRGTWGGVPYFWYNNFWYRSMWWRGMPQFIPVPVETVPQQMQDQWNQWYQMQQQKNNNNNNN